MMLAEALVAAANADPTTAAYVGQHRDPPRIAPSTLDFTDDA
jgi:hypothetical protein